MRISDWSSDVCSSDLILGRRKVIHDLARSDYGAAVSFCGSVLLETKNEEGVGQVPEHPVVRVFDLASHEFYWVHSDYMTPYAFDKSLREIGRASCRERVCRYV